MIFGRGLGFSCPLRCVGRFIVWRLWTVSWFLNVGVFTAFVVAAIVFNGFADGLFELSECVFRHFLLLKETSDYVFDNFAEVLVALGEILVELIDDHLS
jgi:hypothetical protein